MNGWRTLFILVLVLFSYTACKTDEKKPRSPSAEETAVDALPENIGDKTAPTAIKALKGAKEVKKRMDAQRKEDSEVLEQSN
jgi:hypothetical protein